MSPYRPPQGLFCTRSTAIASRSIAMAAGAFCHSAQAQYPYGLVGVVVVVVVVVVVTVCFFAADSLTVCQVPPKLTIPSPKAWPLTLPSGAKRYSGCPLSTSWKNPLRCSSVSLPLTPAGRLSFVFEDLTVSGGQNAKHPLAFVHFR